MVTRLTIVPMKLKLYVTQAAYIAKIDSITESKTTFHKFHHSSHLIPYSSEEEAGETCR